MLVSGRVSSKIPQQNFDSLQEVERERMKELTGRYCKPCHFHSYETQLGGKEWVDSSWLAACDVTFWQPKDLCKLCLWFTSIKVGERIPTKFITRPQNTLITNHPSSSMNPRARNGDQWWFATCWASPGLPQLPRKETEKVKEKRLSPSKVGLLGRVKWRGCAHASSGSVWECLWKNFYIFQGGIQILVPHPLWSGQFPNSPDPLKQTAEEKSLWVSHPRRWVDVSRRSESMR